MLQWWSKAWGCQHCPPRWTKNLAALQINRMKTLRRVKCLPLVGQVPQDLWLKAKGRMQRTKIAENKLGFKFFFKQNGGPRPPSETHSYCHPWSCLGGQQLVPNSLSLNYHSLPGSLGWITARSPAGLWVLSGAAPLQTALYGTAGALAAD